MSDGTLTTGPPLTTVTASSPRPIAPVVGSTAVHITAVRPSGKVEPDGGTHSTATWLPPEVTAVTSKVTFAPAGLVALTVMSGGTVMRGPPVVGTPTPIAFERQLSFQAPPAAESTTCAS